MWEYLKKEKTLVHKGLISLVCSLLIDLSVPIYVGIMTDELKNYQSGTLTEATAQEAFSYNTKIVLLIITVRKMCF